MNYRKKKIYIYKNVSLEMKTCHIRHHTKLREIFTGGFLLRMLTIFNVYVVMKVRTSILLSSHFPPASLLALPA